MLELVFALVALAPRAPGVEITFADGTKVSHYHLPMPIDEQSTRLRSSEQTAPGQRLEVSLRTGVVKDKSGVPRLEYEIRRTAIVQAARAPTTLEDVDVAGAVALPQSGPVTVGEVGGVRVQLEVVR